MRDEFEIARKQLGIEDTSWAYDKLLEIVARSHGEAWPVVIEIAKRSSSGLVLRALAVGPMEDMLCSGGDYYFEGVKRASEECFNFKRALLMGIRITGPGSEKIKKLITEIGEESLRDGWNPEL